MQQQWVQQMVNTFGTAANGGVKYYIMDNEHGLWPARTVPIQPQGVNMDTVRNKIIDYAGKVKAVDSTALVVGPEEWGWTGYIFSGYDAWLLRHQWLVQPAGWRRTTCPGC